jgi:hypothetical protein
MPYTLAQQAELTNNPLRKGIIMGLLEESYLMQKIPWENIGTFQQKVVRWKTLPTSIGYRQLNAAYAEGTGDLEQLMESVYDMGTDIDVDLLFTKDKNTIVDPRALQTKMQLKAIAYFFNNEFINATRATEPDGFNGLKVRIDNMHTDLGSTVQPVKINADDATYGGIDMSPTGRTDSDVHKFLDALNQAIYALDGHKCDMILTNDNALLSFESAFRRAGLLDTSQDMFGRSVTTFKKIPIVDMGVKADQTTKIISDDSDATDKASLYFVRFGVGEHLHGIQMMPLDTRDIGELEGKPVLRTRLQWVCGLAQWHKRSASRLYNVKFT